MLIKSNSDIQKVLSFIEDNHTLAFDIETTGLNTREDEIIGFGVSNETEWFYIAHKAYNIETGLDELISFSNCIKILKALKEKKIVTYNGSFDSRFTLNYFGVNLIGNIYSDGMLSKHTVSEERPFRLKDVAKILYGQDAVEEQRLMKESIKANGGTATEFYKADLELMAMYCGKDCMLTYKIDKHYRNAIAKEGLSSFYFKDEVMPLYREVTIPMELKGVPVDVRALSLAQVEIMVDIENLESAIQFEIAPLLEDFNKWFLWKDYAPKRSGGFAQAIAKYKNWDLPKTSTGKYQITQKTLSSLPDSPEKSFLQGGPYLDDDVVKAIQLTMHDGTYLFNLSSKHHLKKLFFEKLEEEPTSKTDKGNPQVDHFFLLKMAEKYEWCKRLIQYNKLNKLKGAYIDRILEQQEDGIFYPSFFQHRTVSGRYGSDLQQLPRPTDATDVVAKYQNMIRKFFIAGENYKFIDADYESLEPHVFAHVSGDQKLKDIFLKGHDFYSTIAIQTEDLNGKRLKEIQKLSKKEYLSGVSADKLKDNYLGRVAKEKRQQAKAYALGVPYGMESFALSKTLKISQDEAQEKIDGYLNGFPQLKEWMIKSDDTIKEKGMIKSEAGRIRHHPQAPKIWYNHSKYILNALDLWKKFNENPKKYEQMKFLRKKMKNALDNGKNFQIQSLSASIVNRAAIAITRELSRVGIDGYVCANIHDQLVVRVPEEHAKRAQHIVQYLMENTYKISIPLKAPAEIADDFYEGH